MNEKTTMGPTLPALSVAVLTIGLTACAMVVDEKSMSDDPFAQLADPEPAVRAAAVTEVAGGDGPRARAALIHALADLEHEVRLTAAKALATTAAAKILDELIAGLDRDEPEARQGSVLALAYRSETRAYEALMAQCMRRNFAFRWQVGEAIGAAANQAFLPMMLEAVMQGADWRVQEVSVVALTMMQDHVGLDPLLRSLRSEDPYIRRIVCWQLGRIGDPRAIDPLINDMLKKYDTYTLRQWGSTAIWMISHGMDAAMQEQERNANRTNWDAHELAIFARWWAANKQRYLKRE